MIIKSVDAKKIKDSRQDETISVNIKTDVGAFSASAPNGKSKGKYEKKPYKKSIDKDIETIKKFKEYFSEEHIDKFEDLRRIEDIIKSEVGANTLVALEFAALKAMAKEQKKEIWELIRDSTKIKKQKFPRLVGNSIGGGLHSQEVNKKKPDFQEFLLIPKSHSPFEAYEKNKNAKEDLQILLKQKDEFFKSEKNDENAWRSSLNDKEVLEILITQKIPIGLDVAASSFYGRKKYRYNNPKLDRTIDEQRVYLSNIIKNFGIFYIEDPFEENDFESFSELLKKFPDRLIVGDDLTVTNKKRLEKAIEMKSINAMIIKPNQNGSLIELKEVCEIAKKNNIKTVFSHRSGETNESILADLAVGFGADFIKCGITGKEREVKIKRLIEIEKSLTK